MAHFFPPRPMRMSLAGPCFEIAAAVANPIPPTDGPVITTVVPLMSAANCAHTSVAAVSLLYVMVDMSSRKTSMIRL